MTGKDAAGDASFAGDRSSTARVASADSGASLVPTAADATATFPAPPWSPARDVASVPPRERRLAAAMAPAAATTAASASFNFNVIASAPNAPAAAPTFAPDPTVIAPPHPEVGSR